MLYHNGPLDSQTLSPYFFKSLLNEFERLLPPSLSNICISLSFQIHFLGYIFVLFDLRIKANFTLTFVSCNGVN